MVGGDPGGSAAKKSACDTGDAGSIPESGRSPGEGNGNHCSILAGKIPWTEEPGGKSQMRACEHVHAHTHAHTRTHARTHTHTHTHTHTVCSLEFRQDLGD